LSRQSYRLLIKPSRSISAAVPIANSPACGCDPLVGADADVIETDSTGHLLQCFDVLVQVREEVPDVDRSAGFGIAESRGY
jgi:hypothetical protein